MGKQVRLTSRQVGGLHNVARTGRLTRIAGGMWTTPDATMRAPVKGDKRDARHAGKYGDLMVPDWYLEDREIAAMVAARWLKQHGEVPKSRRRATQPYCTITPSGRALIANETV